MDLYSLMAQSKHLPKVGIERENIMKTVDELNEQIDGLQRELIDAKVDLNIKDDRIRTLEKDLRIARNAVRELEIGTHTMRTLALEEDESDFDPYATGEYNTNRWRNAR